MKTMEQFFNEIMTNEETNKKFQAAVDEKKIDLLLKENEVDCTFEEFQQFFAKKLQASGELSDEALENVAGGGFGDWHSELWNRIKDLAERGWDYVKRKIN